MTASSACSVPLPSRSHVPTTTHLVSPTYLDPSVSALDFVPEEDTVVDLFGAILNLELLEGKWTLLLVIIGEIEPVLGVYFRHPGEFCLWCLFVSATGLICVVVPRRARVQEIDTRASSRAKTCLPFLTEPLHLVAAAECCRRVHFSLLFSSGRSRIFGASTMRARQARRYCRREREAGGREATHSSISAVPKQTELDLSQRAVFLSPSFFLVEVPAFELRRLLSFLDSSASEQQLSAPLPTSHLPTSPTIRNPKSSRLSSHHSLNHNNNTPKEAEERWDAR